MKMPRYSAADHREDALLATRTTQMNRIQANFKGNVQGVGFRYTVCRIAEPLTVTGYVKNLPDGSVEMVAEGSQETLSQLVDKICAEMQGNIREHTVDTSPPTEEFTGFNIAY